MKTNRKPARKITITEAATIGYPNAVYTSERDSVTNAKDQLQAAHYAMQTAYELNERFLYHAVAEANATDAYTREAERVEKERLHFEAQWYTQLAAEHASEALAQIAALNAAVETPYKGCVKTNR